MKKKGFTLVELLGVIVVLSIIALIAVPTIIGVIDKSRKNSLQNSGYGLVEAGTLYYAHYQNSKTVRFDVKDNEIKNGKDFAYKGKIKEGTVLINNKGQVVVCINDGKYAAYKNFKDNKVTIVDNKTCTIPENSNIVYLDNEATIDISNEELISRIESLEAIVTEQNKKIEDLENKKSDQTDMNKSISNLTSTHNTDMTLLNNKLGNTNISSIGNGTITGALEQLNNNLNRELSYRKNLVTQHIDEPWYAIKENWTKLESGSINYGRINCGFEYGYVFNKTEDKYGSGIIYGYRTGFIWHVYVYNENFSFENVSVQSLTSF